MNSYIENVLARVQERDAKKPEFLQCVKEVYSSLEKVVEAHPEYEKYAINAAVVYKIMLDLEKLLSGGYYFSDGQRSIYHETAFQDYLQKYFGFRKAYCKLNIKYNPKYKLLFKLCYMVRFILYKFDRISFIYKINSILRMEEIVRKDKRNRSCGKEI